MQKYEVTRTSDKWYDNIPCHVIPCEIHNIGKPYPLFTIDAESLDDAITMLRQEFDTPYYRFVIESSNMEGIEYCIEIYDDYRE